MISREMICISNILILNPEGEEKVLSSKARG